MQQVIVAGILVSGNCELDYWVILAIFQKYLSPNFLDSVKL